MWVNCFENKVMCKDRCIIKIDYGSNGFIEWWVVS